MAYSVRPISQVCEELLKIHFGDVVASVGRYLLRRGNRSMMDIVSATGLSTNETQKALAVLIQSNLVKFQQSVSNQSIGFSANIPNIYRLLRFPKYLYTMKRMFGDYEEMLVEVLLNQGQGSASNIIFTAANRLIEVHGDDCQIEPSKLYEKFKKMARLQFFIRCPDLIASDTVGVPKFNHITDENDKLPFEVPKLDLAPLNLKLKEKATALGEYSDDSIIWKVNFDKFDEESRNVILKKAAARRVDGTAGELYHILLDMWSEISCRNAPTTNPISLHQIKTAVAKVHNSVLLKHLDDYLQVLVEDPSDLLTKSGDDEGGQYVLNFKSVFEKLACATLDSIVLEKFGSKALRLFRIARAKNFIEQDQLLKLSMIVPKDVKMLSYNLLEQNFMQVQELKKGNNSGGGGDPVNSFNLLYVDLPQVARTALELCYKGLFNTMVRKEHMTTITENQRVSESLLLSSLVNGTTEEELAIVEDSLTPNEKSLVHGIKITPDLLTLGELKVDESIFILESYLRFVDE